MTLDRTIYMNTKEIQQLRTVIQAQNILDLQNGRIRGVISWMLIDIALSTGLRVSEIANVTISDIDFKRGGIKVVRAKKKRKTVEMLAVGCFPSAEVAQVSCLS